MEYDSKNNTSGWRECMRIRIKIDVRKPLKRRKKIMRKNGTEVIVNCKYERLREFCFTCGLVSHTDRYCGKLLENTEEVGENEWGVWLKAPPRRVAGVVKIKWLRDEGDVNWGERNERHNNIPKSGVNQMRKFGNQDKVVTHIVAVKESSGSSSKVAGVDTFSNPLLWAG